LTVEYGEPIRNPSPPGSARCAVAGISLSRELRYVSKVCSGTRGMSMRKRIYVEKANVGNLMFRYMFAEHLRRQFPQSVITGASMPEWAINHGDEIPGCHLKLTGGNIVDVPRLLEAMQNPDIDGVVLGCYVQRLEYFEERRDEFVSRFHSFASGQETRDDELVIHVRAGDVLSGPHPHYNLVPVSYHRRLLERTGLKPVFIGQTQPSYYADALRRAFPNARFLAGNHWLDDFQTLRNARNIALSVSTFAWLAAWLSETAQLIFQPQLGFLNPRQCPDVDLAPENDARYVYEQFPVEEFTASPEQIARVIA